MKLSFKSGSTLRIFSISGLITIASLLFVAFFLGTAALLVALVLIAVELAFSFDNAIINAKVLARMSPFWQKMFLTVGVVIAIFGMRVVFPMLIVMLTAHVSWSTVTDLALHHPSLYAEKLHLAHPDISAFGGSFLLMLALHFFMDDHREIHWIDQIERPLARLARWWVPAVVSVGVLAFFAYIATNDYTVQIVRAGSVGIILYLGINLFTEWIGGVAERKTSGTHQTGLVALLTFMYLQVLDASFSFDGVIGAFAITDKIVLIAIGLGVGALWVRSLTVFMVHRGTLDAYRYLEHGAHYAVFALALTMFVSLLVEIPEYVTGGLGIGLITASIIASVRANRLRSA